MRNLRRSNREQDEEESVFVPMTDMTVSFLFIVMILLAFFAARFSDKDTVPRPVYDELHQKYIEVVTERDRLLVTVKELEDQKHALEGQVSDLEEENEALRAEIVRLKSLIDELRVKIADLERKLREQNPLEAYVLAAQAERLAILQQIEDALKIEFKDDILVEISPENDALRFKGEGLFTSGSRSLIASKRPVVNRLAELIANAISCYTVNEREVDYKTCNPSGIVIEAVQIEGHTDSDDSDERNLELSTARANNAFLTMWKHQPDLLSYRNIRGQPVISVAGYGEMRPIASNDTSAGKAENRRIDLRLIMYTPRDREQVERIQKQIEDGLRLAVEEFTHDEP